MGMTIWVLRKSRAEDVDEDRTLFHDSADALDGVAEELGVRKLSEFFDFTDLQFNMSEEELPESWIAEHQKWHAPSDVLSRFRAILRRIEEQGLNGLDAEERDALLEELGDCLAKVEAAEAEGDRFHFCVVM